MAYIRKIKGSLVKVDSADYIGEESYLFYDIDTGCLRMWDGTPGGKPICGGSGGSGGVESYPTVGDFPIPGEADTIYIALDADLIYHWDGSHYVPLISPGADDNVQTYANTSAFPLTGIADVLYIDESTNSLYRWDGSAYVSVGANHDHAVITIPAGNTATLYSADPGGNLSMKFILSALDTVSGNFASSEVMGTYKLADDSVSHTHYALVGDLVAYLPNLVYSGPNVQLNITNNEANPLTVSVMRIPTLPIS